ncbi:MAG: FkbM family methyltransferase [Burkholderiaceae bacterium]|nr:FkbM family methyltransferase [Burkholderiaceae bacterium]
MHMISYAQNFEDVMLWRLFHDIGAGIYVDVGANDPVVDSVTCWFYQQGWRGINIEPVPSWHQRLVVARPADINLQVAVSCETGYVTLYDVPSTGLATMNQQFAADHQRGGETVSEIRVQSVQLDALLAEHLGDSTIHFLKIDVEGAERDVLQSTRLDRFRPWVILVEATEPRRPVPNHETWEPLLTDRGYAFAYFDGLNRWYVAKEHSHLAAGLSTPPNTFDDFVRHAQWQAHKQVLELQDQIRHLNGVNEQWQRRTAQVESERDACQSELAGRIQQLRDVENSTSWRMTAPVRKLRQRLRARPVEEGGFHLPPVAEIEIVEPVAQPPKPEPAAPEPQHPLPDSPARSVTAGDLLLHQISAYWRRIDHDALGNAAPVQLSCPLCGHNASGAEFAALHAQCRFGGGRLQRHQCPACDVIFGPSKMLDLNASELSQEYDWHYRLFAEGDSTAQELRAFHSLEPRREGVYLNYGAGAWSASVKILREQGWNVLAYEPTGSAQNAPALITQRDQLASMRFDGIYSNNVLEHFRHPVDELRFLSGLLLPDGKMSHATPCYEYLYEYTRFHLFFYLGRSRQLLAERAGLTLCSYERDGEFMNAVFQPIQ